MDNSPPTAFYRIIRPGYWPDTIDNVDECTNSLQIKTILEEFRSSRKDNKISLWASESYEDAVLSLISNQYQDIDDLFVVKLNGRHMVQCGVELEHCRGNSVFNWLNNSHYDMKNVNYNNLRVLIKEILTALKDRSYSCLMKEDIDRLVRQLVAEDKIPVRKLPKCLQDVLASGA